MAYILAYDIGTTGVKTCLFQVKNQITLIAGATAGYGLYMMKDGGAEQDAEEWWNAMCISTKKVNYFENKDKQRNTYENII